MQNNKRAFEEFIIDCSLKDPYPNNAETISSEPSNKAIEAGNDKNKQSSTALF